MQTQNLKVMGLVIKQSYILACYMSLTKNYNWDTSIVCECADVTKLDSSSDELLFHHCPTHIEFKPHLLCSSHLECNDPITRCFLLAKACSDMAEKCTDYEEEYRDL